MLKKDNNCISFWCFLFLLFGLLVFSFSVFLYSISVDFNENVSIQVSSFNSREKLVIVVDPGHGGMDGGAVGFGGICEKDINLSISKYLCDFINLSGVNCVLTRADDNMLSCDDSPSNKKRDDLKARVRFTESFDNPIFISIHQNKFEISKYKGMQVFYSKNNSESAALANIIKDNNFKLIDYSNTREIKPAGKEIMVLHNLRSPAVLVECGFLSNADEAYKLSTEEYRKKIAFMLYISIMDYVFL